MTLMLEIAGGIVLGVVALAMLPIVLAAVVGAPYVAARLLVQTVREVKTEAISVVSEWNTASHWIRAWAYSLIGVALALAVCMALL